VGGLLDVEPFAIILEQELVAARGVSESNAENGTGSVDTHTSSSLLATSDVGQVITGPHSEDGTDREIGINDGRAIKRIESNRESTATEVNSFGDFLRASKLAASRVAEGFKKELVGKHVNSELFVTERVDARGGAARSSADLVGDGADSLRHGHHELAELGIVGVLEEEFFEGVTKL
jgi:hypothetical protein